MTLAEDDDDYVRLAVAGNPSTPPEILETLAEDDDSFVRLDVAGNPSTPPETLVTLAEVLASDDKGL